jgi:hypothetical protein
MPETTAATVLEMKPTLPPELLARVFDWVLGAEIRIFDAFLTPPAARQFFGTCPLEDPAALLMNDVHPETVCCCRIILRKQFVPLLTVDSTFFELAVSKVYGHISVGEDDENVVIEIAGAFLGPRRRELYAKAVRFLTISWRLLSSILPNATELRYLSLRISLDVGDSDTALVMEAVGTGQMERAK